MQAAATNSSLFGVTTHNVHGARPSVQTRASNMTVRTSALPINAQRASMSTKMSLGGYNPTFKMTSAAPNANKFVAQQRSSHTTTMAVPKRSVVSMLMGSSTNNRYAGISSQKAMIGQKIGQTKTFTAAPQQSWFGGNIGARGAATVMAAGAWDQETCDKLEAASKHQRLLHLEEQAMDAIKQAVDSGANVVFPNALIAGDVVMTHLISRLGLFDKIPVLFVNTLHLFEETLDFIDEIEKEYDFKGHISMAEGITGDRYEAKKQFDKKYGADLWKLDIEQYDKVCKVEPFLRGLSDLNCETMITGRTRWQGNERAWIDIFEAPKKAGGRGNVNPIAHWTLEDTFNYIAHYKIAHHPLHAEGYPSIGDAKDTIPIPEDKSTTFKNFEFQGDKTEWLGYALERKGRFVGLANKDGSTKTECGIHVDGAEKTFDRDLWESASITNLDSTDAAKAFKEKEEGLLVIYAPWCQFCQGMEEEYQKFADANPGVKVAKYRGDLDRDFSEKVFEVASFPTVVSVKDGKITKYESENRSAEDFKKFVGV